MPHFHLSNNTGREELVQTETESAPGEGLSSCESKSSVGGSAPDCLETMWSSKDHNVNSMEGGKNLSQPGESGRRGVQSSDLSSHASDQSELSRVHGRIMGGNPSSRGRAAGPTQGILPDGTDWYSSGPFPSNCKSLLNNALSRRLRAPCRKGEVVYKVEESEPIRCSVYIHSFASMPEATRPRMFYTGHACKTLAEAENTAAVCAILGANLAKHCEHPFFDQVFQPGQTSVQNHRGVVEPTPVHNSGGKCKMTHDQKKKDEMVPPSEAQPGLSTNDVKKLLQPFDISLAVGPISDALNDESRPDEMEPSKSTDPHVQTNTLSITMSDQLMSEDEDEGEVLIAPAAFLGIPKAPVGERQKQNREVYFRDKALGFNRRFVDTTGTWSKRPGVVWIVTTPDTPEYEKVWQIEGATGHPKEWETNDKNRYHREMGAKSRVALKEKRYWDWAEAKILYVMGSNAFMGHPQDHNMQKTIDRISAKLSEKEVRQVVWQTMADEFSADQIRAYLSNRSTPLPVPKNDAELKKQGIQTVGHWSAPNSAGRSAGPQYGMDKSEVARCPWQRLPSELEAEKKAKKEREEKAARKSNTHVNNPGSSSDPPNHLKEAIPKNELNVQKTHMESQDTEQTEQQHREPSIDPSMSKNDEESVSSPNNLMPSGSLSKTGVKVYRDEANVAWILESDATLTQCQYDNHLSYSSEAWETWFLLDDEQSIAYSAGRVPIYKPEAREDTKLSEEKKEEEREGEKSASAAGDEQWPKPRAWLWCKKEDGEWQQEWKESSQYESELDEWQKVSKANQDEVSVSTSVFDAKKQSALEALEAFEACQSEMGEEDTQCLTVAMRLLKQIGK